MIRSLNDLIERLLQATTPEDLFGVLAGDGAESLRSKYRALAMVAHPDYNPGQWAAANEAFRQLQEWYGLAQQKLSAGVYGQSERIRITSGSTTYVGYQAALGGDLCDLYPVHVDGGAVLLKVARSSRSSDLMQAEAYALRRLNRELHDQPVRAHFPVYRESFRMRDATGVQRSVNVLNQEPDTFTLAEVLRRYPQGLHPADAAWMFNRMLAALATSHSLGLVHGAIVPDHVLIRPADHNGILIDWCYSVQIGTPIKAISPAYADDYPPEVTARQAATTATDIYMAARLMIRLLGGQDGQPPARTPKPIHALLRACLIPAPARRHQDAWQVLDDFRAILAELYGPPTFRPFRMP